MPLLRAPIQRRAVNFLEGAVASRRLVQASNILTLKPFIGNNAASVTGRTYHTVLEAPGHFDYVRVAILNNSTSLRPGVDALSFATSASKAVTELIPKLADGSDGAWVTGTFDSLGADSNPGLTAGSAQTLATGIVPLGTTVSGSSVENFCWSDWAQVSSLDRVDVVGGRPLLMVRIYSAAEQLNLVGAPTTPTVGWNTYPGGRFANVPYWLGYQKSGNFAGAGLQGTVLTGWTAQGTIYAVQFLSRQQGMTVYVTGDSISQGAAGGTTYQAISAASCTGTTATITVSDGTKWTATDTINVQGLGTGYDGFRTVTVVAGNNISFAVPNPGSLAAVASPSSAALAGYESGQHFGYIQRAVGRLSSLDRPISMFAGAVRGNTTPLFGARAMRQLPFFRPDVAFLPSMSTNNGLTVADGLTGWAHFRVLSRECLRLGIVPVMFAPIPNDRTINSINDGKEQAANVAAGVARARAWRAAGGYVVDCFDEFTAGGTDKYTRWNTRYTDDGYHPNDLGYEIMADKAEVILRRIAAGLLAP